MTWFIAIRATFFATVFVGLWTWLAILVQRYDVLVEFSFPTFVVPIGGLVGTAGTVLVVICISHFVISGQGTPAPIDAPRNLVVGGPFRYVRNPMYIGAFTVILGAGLAFRSPSILLLSAFFILLAHCFVLVYEEPVLKSKFGASYLDYLSNVPRWIPDFGSEKPID